eukprot:gene22672-38226_t
MRAPPPPRVRQRGEIRGAEERRGRAPPHRRRDRR